MQINTEMSISAWIPLFEIYMGCVVSLLCALQVIWCLSYTLEVHLKHPITESHSLCNQSTISPDKLERSQ